MNAEEYKRFLKWLTYIRTNIGLIDEKAGLYMWALYEHLLDEVKQANEKAIEYKINIQSNGKEIK